MFSKEKFNKLIDDHMKNLNDNEKQQMYKAMYEKCTTHKHMTGEHLRPQKMHTHNTQRGDTMMEMMCGMMGRGMRDSHKTRNNPMQQCMEMMSTMMKQSEESSYSTDELMDLFKDWCAQVEDEILAYIDDSGEINPNNIAEKFHLSKESVSHLLKNMRKAGKITDKQRD